MVQARKELPSSIRTPARVCLPKTKFLSVHDFLYQLCIRARTSANLLYSDNTGGLQIEGENDSYDFGSGAGFYVDATKAPYSNGYKMYSYITEELPKTIFPAFQQLDSSRVSITGHSMGGHGALTLVRTHKHKITYIPLETNLNRPGNLQARH